MRIARMAEKGSKTTPHRGFYRKRKKKKHTEDSKARRKHRHSEGNGYAALKRGK